MNKLVVGTANFGKKYGLLGNRFNKKHFRKILNTLSKNKINFLDTSLEYYISNKSLNLQKFKIITKIKLPRKKKIIYLKNLKKNLNNHLKKFKLKKFYSVLIHNVEDLENKYGLEALNILKNFKQDRKIDKIGVSIYEIKDLKKVFKVFKPDIIQIPLNIFNQEFFKKNIIRDLKNKKILVQVRSIFLQGLLTQNEKILKKFKVKKKLLEKISSFKEWCLNNNFSQAEACIYFVKNIKGIDLITIGFNNKDELKQILNYFKNKKKINLKKFKLNKKYIDPRKW